MVDQSLEDFQRRQAAQISQDIIRQSQTHGQQVQANSQQLWQIAHDHLVALLRQVDSDYDEYCEKANHPLESFSDADLFYLIRVRMQMSLDASRSGSVCQKEDPGELKRLRGLLRELEQKFTRLDSSHQDLLEKNQILKVENDGLTSHLSALRQSQKEALAVPSENEVPVPAPVPLPIWKIPEDAPGWMKTWGKSRGFERGMLFVQIMGDTGKALRPSLVRSVIKRLTLSQGNNSVVESLNRLIIAEDGRPALVEEIETTEKPGASAGGNNPSVLRLTAEGQTVYKLLTGRQTQENEYDLLLRRHSSPEHTILNIQASETLEEWSDYQILSQANSIQTDNGETYIPDITAVDRRTGELIFVEVERDVHKDHHARKQRWLNAYHASNGNLYVFCDNLNCQRAVQAEINHALGGLNYNSYLTNLHGLRNEKRSGKDGGIWLASRQER